MDVLNNPPEPTRGFLSSIYHWLDLTLGVFDTSGQELNDILVEETLQTSVFENVDIVLYVLDFNTWLSERPGIIQEIIRIYNILKEYGKNAKLEIIFHKMDLISYQIEGIFNLISDNINSQLGLSEKLTVFFTSIKRDLLFSTYKAISEILSNFSIRANDIITQINKIIDNYPKSICFITNESNNIIVHSFSKDFNIEFIPQIYKNIELLSRTSKIKLLNTSGIYLTDSHTNILNFFMDTIKGISDHFQRIIVFSEILKNNKLRDFSEKLKEIITIENNKILNMSI